MNNETQVIPTRFGANLDLSWENLLVVENQNKCSPKSCTPTIVELKGRDCMHSVEHSQFLLGECVPYLEDSQRIENLTSNFDATVAPPPNRFHNNINVSNELCDVDKSSYDKDLDVPLKFQECLAEKGLLLLEYQSQHLSAVSNFRDILASKDAEIGALEKSLTNLQMKYDVLDQKLLTAVLERDKEKEEYKNELRRQKFTYEVEIDALRKKDITQEYERRIAGLQLQLEELMQTKLSLQETVTELLRTNSQLEEHASRIEKDNALLKSSRSRITEVPKKETHFEITSSNGTMETPQHITILESRIQELEQCLKRRSEQISQLTSALRTVKDREIASTSALASQSALLSELQQRWIRLDEENQVLCSECDTLRAKQRELEEDIAVLRQENESMEEKIRADTEIVENARPTAEALITLSNEVKTLEEQNELLSNSLLSLKIENRKEIFLLQQKNKELMLIVQELNKDSHTSQLSLASAHAQNPIGQSHPYLQNAAFFSLSDGISGNGIRAEWVHEHLLPLQVSNQSQNNSDSASKNTSNSEDFKCTADESSDSSLLKRMLITKNEQIRALEQELEMEVELNERLKHELEYLRMSFGTATLSADSPNDKTQLTVSISECLGDENSANDSPNNHITCSPLQLALARSRRTQPSSTSKLNQLHSYLTSGAPAEAKQVLQPTVQGSLPINCVAHSSSNASSVGLLPLPVKNLEMENNEGSLPEDKHLIGPSIPEQGKAGIPALLFQALLEQYLVSEDIFHQLVEFFKALLVTFEAVRRRSMASVRDGLVVTRSQLPVTSSGNSTQLVYPALPSSTASRPTRGLLNSLAITADTDMNMRRNSNSKIGEKVLQDPTAIAGNKNTTSSTLPSLTTILSSLENEITALRDLQKIAQTSTSNILEVPEVDMHIPKHILESINSRGNSSAIKSHYHVSKGVDQSSFSVIPNTGISRKSVCASISALLRMTEVLRASLL